MAHSSSHYIRTIHTSFTAAHASPWARTNAVPLNTPLYQVPCQRYPQTPVVYESPTPAAPPASGAGGRRRAYAFRAPSPSPVCGSYKFDPFADEAPAHIPSIVTVASPPAPTNPRLAAASPSPHAPHRPLPRRQIRGYHPRPGFHNQRMRSNSSSFMNNQESARYAPPTTEIWRSSHSSVPRGRSLTCEFEEYDCGGGGAGNGRVSPPPLSTPAPVQQQARRTPSPPSSSARIAVSSTPPNRFFTDKDAKAKLVAGILLNRVHAVGKPRRRVQSPVGGPKVYVPSCLSTVVACGA